jgi:hypothetical protein
MPSSDVPDMRPIPTTGRSVTVAPRGRVADEAEVFALPALLAA